MARDDIGLDIDIKSFQRSLDDSGWRALPKAAAATLNGIAFDAQRGLKAAMERDFDRPNAFTLRGFKVDKQGRPIPWRRCRRPFAHSQPRRHT